MRNKIGGGRSRERRKEGAKRKKAGGSFFFGLADLKKFKTGQTEVDSVGVRLLGNGGKNKAGARESTGGSWQRREAVVRSQRGRKGNIYKLAIAESRRMEETASKTNRI